MADPPELQEAQPFDSRTRPESVTVVVWTQYLTAAALVLAAVSFVAVQGTVQSEAEQLMHHDLTGDFELASSEIDWVVQGSFAIMAVFYVLLAACYAVLAAFNGKGVESTRVLSWILSGLALACCLPASLFTRLNDDFFAHRSLLPQDSGGLDYSNEANKWVQAATPDWVTALDWLAVLLLTVGALPIIILLARPAAHRYFQSSSVRPGSSG